MYSKSDNDDSYGLISGIGSFFHNMATDLKIFLAFTTLTVAVINLPAINETVIRSALDLITIIFIPGYALLAALFPGKDDIEGIERLALGFGLSVASLLPLCMVINFMSWRMGLDLITLCLAAFIFICLLIANMRRHSLPEGKSFSVDIGSVFREVMAEAFPASGNKADKLLTLVLIVAVASSACIVAFIIIGPSQSEKFTEFFILGPGGKADNYPVSFAPGEQKPVLVGITNHEYANKVYDLVVTLNDSNATGTIYRDKVTLANNETWEKTVQLKPDRIGKDMDMEFLLYVDGNMTAPYRDLHLWVNVSG